MIDIIVPHPHRQIHTHTHIACASHLSSVTSIFEKYSCFTYFKNQQICHLFQRFPLCILKRILCTHFSLKMGVTSPYQKIVSKNIYFVVFHCGVGFQSHMQKNTYFNQPAKYLLQFLYNSFAFLPRHKLKRSASRIMSLKSWPFIDGSVNKITLLCCSKQDEVVLQYHGELIFNLSSFSEGAF